MKWFTHQTIALGAALAAHMPLPAVAAAFVGSVAPDMMDMAVAGKGKDGQREFNRIHRGASHWFGWWLGLWLVGLSTLFPPMAAMLSAGFGLGALIHVALDMCTVNGVPPTPWSRQNKLTLGLCKTGGAGEYLFLSCSVVIFWLWMWQDVARVLDKAHRFFV